MGKSSSTICSLLPALVLLGAQLLFSGCASTFPERPLHVRRSDMEHIERAHERARETAKPQSSPAVASLQLTGEGRALLENNQVDGAIDVLEQSINLDPTNGESYYYLAEAWFVKGDIPEAQEFNELAGLYSRDNPNLIMRVIQQRDRLLNQ